MQPVVRGKYAVIGASIGVVLLTASMGSAVAHTDSASPDATAASDHRGVTAAATPVAGTADAAPRAEQMDEMMRQCMDMMEMMGNMPGMMPDDGSAAPVMQR